MCCTMTMHVHLYARVRVRDNNCVRRQLKHDGYHSAAAAVRKATGTGTWLSNSKQQKQQQAIIAKFQQFLLSH